MIKYFVKMLMVYPLHSFLGSSWSGKINLFLVNSFIGYKDLKHGLTRMGDECNCSMVSTYFSTTSPGNWDEDWPFPVLWTLLSLQICWRIECYSLMASSFKVLSSSTGIPSHPLALLTAVLPKSHLTSLCRISGSGWLTIPSK